MPSKLLGNEEVTDNNNIKDYFKLVEEFENKVNVFASNDTNQDNVIRAVFSLPSTADLSEHIIEKEGTIGKTITTKDKLLIGKFSFKMLTDEFSIVGFNLVESEEHSPTTGIKINLNATQCYEAQKTFIFTDATASKDADLQNLLVSRGEDIGGVEESPYYKEYDLSPTFNKNEKAYEVIIKEYIDDVDITATTNDEKAKMKIKVPKHDPDGNLVYLAGDNIDYEEKDLDSGQKMNVQLNKLGDLDTIVTIIVTAEDGVTLNTYTVTIKRPYGILTGKAILADFDDEDVVQNRENLYDITITNKVEINLYEAGVIEWESISDIFGTKYENPTTYDDVNEVPKLGCFESEDDGTFRIYVIPGTYDIEFMRLGYIDYIYSDVVINDGDTINVEEFRLPAGDVDRNGNVTQEDLALLKSIKGMLSTDPEFLPQYNPSQIGTVSQEDMAYVKDNKNKAEVQIDYFGN